MFYLCTNITSIYVVLYLLFIVLSLMSVKQEQYSVFVKSAEVCKIGWIKENNLEEVRKRLMMLYIYVYLFINM